MQKGNELLPQMFESSCSEGQKSEVREFSELPLSSHGQAVFPSFGPRNPRMFKLYFGPKPALAVTHPELARQVLTRPKAIEHLLSRNLQELDLCKTYAYINIYIYIYTH